MGWFSKKKKTDIKKTKIPDNILQKTFDEIIDDFVFYNKINDNF